MSVETENMDMVKHGKEAAILPRGSNCTKARQKNKIRMTAV